MMDKIQSTVYRNVGMWCQTDVSTLTDDLTLKSLDLDSMNMIEIQLGLESELAINLQEEQFLVAETVGEIVRVVRDSAAQDSPS